METIAGCFHVLKGPESTYLRRSLHVRAGSGHTEQPEARKGPTASPLTALTLGIRTEARTRHSVCHVATGVGRF